MMSSEIFANRPGFVEIAPKQFKVCAHSGSFELWQAFAIGSQREVAALNAVFEEGHKPFGCNRRHLTEILAP